MEEKPITIEKVVYGGKGLSRDLQKVAFVPFTLPGEKVRIQIRKEHRDYLEADPVDILEPSKNRVDPECVYFGRCGGCQLSHARYETQVEMKLAMLTEALERAHIAKPEIQVMTDTPFAYRHRAQLKWDGRQKRLGFHESETNRIVDIKECLCLTPALNLLLKELRSALLSVPVPRLSEIECYENDRGETAVFFNAPVPAPIMARLSPHTVVLDYAKCNSSPLTFHFRDYEFPMRPDIFLQINPKMIRQMVMELESHYDSDLERTALELYCGSGLFTFSLARRFKRIIACEENKPAIEFAQSHHPAQNISWICEKVERVQIPDDVSAMIVDPPRAGLHRRLIESLLNRTLEKISYVSCDVSSFSRDMKMLGTKYLLRKLTLLDLFPQTYHFETIALLEPA